MKILFLGDIVGNTGRRVVRENALSLKATYGADIIVANGENAAGGSGITPPTADEIFSSGIDLITTGNHIWNRKEVFKYLDTNSHRICRPLNYYSKNPGVGFVTYQPPESLTHKKVTFVNLAGRVFMSELADCPFTALENFLETRSKDERGITIVDFHAEATSEKTALAVAFDGKVDAVLGTHTHVQTADERVLKNGTAYISDVGMCGAYESIIGVESRPVISRFVTGISSSFGAADGIGMINGVLLDFSQERPGIERVRFTESGA
jgi:metallophosphoesterase (TIGR00282 family)